mmetsp:Transcript_59850/g.90217  ORF Transcript_59850/g.90217 Transcript_59850/m.90217 type:complete len:222 (-) Transcript_59850:526-1191(-)
MCRRQLLRKINVQLRLHGCAFPLRWAPIRADCACRTHPAKKQRVVAFGNEVALRAPLTFLVLNTCQVLHSVPGRAVANAVQTKLIRLPSGPEFIQIVDSADAMPVAHGPEGARLTIEFVGIDDVVRSPAPLISALTRSTPITLLDVVVVASKCSPQSAIDKPCSSWASHHAVCPVHVPYPSSWYLSGGRTRVIIPREGTRSIRTDRTDRALLASNEGCVRR